MKKETILDYLKDVFNPTINDLISLELHYCYLEFDCESQINLALDEFKKNKSIPKLYDLCLEKIGKIEINDFSENDEIDSFWIHFSTMIDLYNKFYNCIYFTTKKHGLFNDEPVQGKVTPKQFFTFFRFEFINAIAEFLKESLSSVNALITLRTGSSKPPTIFNFIFKISDEIISKVVNRDNSDKDYSIIKSIYKLFNEIEKTQEQLSDKYGWDDNDEYYNKDSKINKYSKDKIFLNLMEEEKDRDIFDIIETFLDAYTELITIYELTLSALESKFTVDTSTWGTIAIDNSYFINEYQYRRHELINSEVDWVYNSYCSFMVS